MRSVVGREIQAADEPLRASEAPLQPLIEAIDRVQSARTVDELMEIVRSAARRLSGADGVTIVLRDGDQCHYVDEDAISPLWKGQRFPLISCISGWAMLHRQTAEVPDVFADARLPHDAYRPTFVRSLVMVPIGGEEKTAAIGAYWSRVRTPDPWEVAVLDALARSTGAALKNIELLASLSESAARAEQLYEQAQQELVERRRAEAESRLLSRELGHRVKNILAIVQSLALQTETRGHSVETFRTAFLGRLQALARAQDLLLEAQDCADLRSLIDQTLEAYRLDDPGRVEITGAPVALASRQALALGLVLHELGTNAAKYGALSRAGGRVEIAWRVEPSDDGQQMRLRWAESDGPPVLPPQDTGFGTRLIERACTHELDGSVALEFAPEGLRCAIAFPLL